MEEWRYALKKNLNKQENFNGYEKWKEAANTFIYLKKIYPNRVYIQKYSDMLKYPYEESKKLFTFCGLGYTDSTVDFLKKSANFDNADAYAVFRSKQSDNKWKTELHLEIVEQILTDLRDGHLEEYAEQDK
ncbi:MAG: hypothetical protein B6244_09425 [Candidatus Cloacimonetes bacterium 4572_55]|nr:MAG: hypothetical protein B6244_09425 [Candidatus Cloacimonetes bacterium 4572_55]